MTIDEEVKATQDALRRLPWLVQRLSYERRLKFAATSPT
jgi:hypothetical protein